MKFGIRAIATACIASGLWAVQASAVPVVVEMEVVSINGVDIIPADEVTAAPGDVLEVDFYASDWTPDELFFYQIRLEGASLENAPDSYLDLAEFPCATSADCPNEEACIEGICDTSCLDAIIIDSLRPDFVFFKRSQASSGACESIGAELDPRSYAFGSSLISITQGAVDQGVRRYLGTMLFQLSDSACGTFDISMIGDPNNTFFGGTGGAFLSSDVSATLRVNSTVPECVDECQLFVSTVPADCSIDARQPHALNDANATEGWDSIEVTLDCTDASDLTPDNFTVFEPGLFVDIIVDIDSVEFLGGSTVRVNFARQITPEKWTCINTVGGPFPNRSCLGYLPADVNQDRTSAPADILGVIDCLNGVAGFDCNLFNTDVDRSAEAGPPDILRVIDLLNGASAFDVWLDRTLPACP